MADYTSVRTSRERQLDALIAEYYEAVELGRPLNQAEFLGRHPEFSTELRDFFADVGQIEQVAPPLDQALEDTRSVSGSTPTSIKTGMRERNFGDYEILEELGAGGMGVVYKARQTKLKKIVALKMIKVGHLASDSEVRRFQAEAQAAAKLDHPGIVPVHEVGVHQNQHYYAMDYVGGDSLSKLHRDEPVASRRAAELVQQLSEAMHYAHGQGIVHRDLKPANVLLTTGGAPRITDFGLAKRLWSDDESAEVSMTQSGQILGTAGYMSPEQAAGKTRLVKQPADIYALGAVLYALLTSRAPFVGESQADTILQVIQNEPVSPRVLNPSVPRDLETICLKCLEKEPHKRYGTAQLLADDLGRFLGGRPVLARPVGHLAHAWRWCRRNPWAATALALVMLVAVVSPPVAYQQYRLTQTTVVQKEDIEKQSTRISEDADKIKEQFSQITDLFGDVNKELDEKNAALKKVTEAESVARDARGLAEAEAAAKSLTLYVSDMNRMQELWQAASLRTMRSLLARHVPAPGKPDLRDFEWYYWQRQCHQERREFVHGQEARLLGLSADGNWLAMAGPIDKESHAVKVLNLATGQVKGPLLVAVEEIVAIKFTADGSNLVTVRQGNGAVVNVLNWQTGEQDPPLPLRRGHDPKFKFPAEVGHFSVSPSGKLVASSHRGSVSCLSLANRESLRIQLPDDADLQLMKAKYGVIYRDPQGRYVYFKGDVAGTHRSRNLGRIDETSTTSDLRFSSRSWKINDELAPPSEEDGGPVFALQFSPAEDRLAAGSRHGELVVWEFSSGKELIKTEAHTDLIWDIAFSADGKLLATASKDGRLKLWDVPSGKLRATMEAHAGGVRAVEFSKRGMLVSGGSDQCVKVWSAVTGSAIATFRGHEQTVLDVAIRANGETILSTSRDGTVKEWSLGDLDQPIVVANRMPLACLDLFPGGDFVVATGHQFNDVSVWELGTGQIKATLSGQREPAYHVRIAPDGNSVVSGTWDGTFTTWDVASGKIIAQKKLPIVMNQNPMPAVAISPNARRVAAACPDGKVRIFDLGSGEPIVTLEGDVPPDRQRFPPRIRFAPDGVELLTIDRNDKSFDIRLWNAETGAAAEVIATGVEWALPAFSDDGKLLAWSERLGDQEPGAVEVKVWDRSAKEVRQRLALPADVFIRAMTFSTDRSLLAALTSPNKPAKGEPAKGEPAASALVVWDVATGRELHHWEEAGAALCFLPDGNSIAVAGDSGRVNLWSLAEARKLRELARPLGPALSVVFAPNVTAFKEPKLLVFSRSPPREGLLGGQMSATTKLAQSDLNRQKQTMSSVSMHMKTVFQPLSNGTLNIRGSLDGLLVLGAEARKRFGYVNNAINTVDAYAPSANCIFALSPNGTLLKGLADKQTPVKYVERAVEKVEDARAMTATADGRWVALAIGNDVQLWDGDQLERQHTLKGHEDYVRSLAFSRNGDLLATAGSDRSVRLWNTSDGSLRATLLGHSKPITCLAFSERGGTVVSSSYDGTIRLWDTATGEAKSTLTGHEGPVHWIEFSQEGDELVSAGEDGTIRLWKAPRTVDANRKLPEPVAGKATPAEGPAAETPE